MENRAPSRRQSRSRLNLRWEVHFATGSKHFLQSIAFIMVTTTSWLAPVEGLSGLGFIYCGVRVRGRWVGRP